MPQDKHSFFACLNSRTDSAGNTLGTACEKSVAISQVFSFSFFFRKFFLVEDLKYHPQGFAILSPHPSGDFPRSYHPVHKLIKIWHPRIIGLNKDSKWKSLSCVRLFATWWIVASQAPLSLGFSRKEPWSGYHSLLQETFLTQGLNLDFLHCRQIIYCLSHQESPQRF